jgi:hypothetical protein
LSELKIKKENLIQMEMEKQITKEIIKPVKIKIEKPKKHQKGTTI